MKYVRNYEDFKRYSFEFFDSFLPQDLSEEMVNSFLLDLGDKDQLERQALSYIKFQPLDQVETADYGEAILQLNDYRSLLKKFVELLLKSNSYEALCAFLNRIFVPEIGDAKYHSHKKDYSIDERYFDRFVEITEYCKIDRGLYTPFYVAILNSDSSSPMFIFKEPLKEYLDIFLKDSGEDDEFISSLLVSESKTGIDEYASVSSTKTLKMLLTQYAQGELNNSTIIKKILLKNKQEGFNIIEELLNNEDDSVRFRAVQMLVLIKEDRRVSDRLKFIYKNSSDSKIKNYLEKECGFSSLTYFASKEEFIDYVDKSISQIQERLFGARLKRYYEEYKLDNSGINGKILTFVMEFFKSKDLDMQLGNLKTYFKYVGSDILNKLARVVFEVAVYRDRLQASKWSLRLIAAFGDSQLISSMTDILKSWSVNSSKEAYSKYFIELLMLAKREEVIDVVRELLKLDLSNKQKKFLNNILVNYSLTTNQNIEEVNDKLVDDFGFDKNGSKEIELKNKIIKIQINVDCSLSLINVKTGKRARIRAQDTLDGENLKTYLKRLQKEVKKQKKRLYSAFLEFRQYDLGRFKECILDNNLLNFLSQNLIWARYKNDKLVEVCMLEHDNLVHLAGNLVIENFDEYLVALLQPMDAVEYKNNLKGRFNTLFDQFDLPIFLPSELALNMSYVGNLSGTFCNAKLFITRLQKLKYKINDLDAKNEFSILCKENKNLGILTAVEFDKVNLYKLDCSTTLSRVVFYNLNKLTKSGKNYNLDMHEAIVLKDINSRVLSNELALIMLACKN